MKSPKTCSSLILASILSLGLLPQSIAASTLFVEAVDTVEKEVKTNIFLGTEFSSLQTDSESFSGYGVRLGVQYGFSDAFGVGFYLGQTYGGGEAGLSSLYSNFSTSLSYAITGSFITRDKYIMVGQHKVVTQNITKTSIWDVGLTAEQMFLNGANQAYPATGLSLETGKDFQFNDRWWKLSMRYSQLVVQSKSMSGLFLNLYLEWPY